MQNCKNLLCCVIAVMCGYTGFTQGGQPLKKTGTPKTTTAVTKPVNQVATAATVITETGNFKLGRYELYSGVPSIYIGHFVLLNNGKYKVAFNTDEENYDERGTYTFHNETNSIEWIGGMFKNNNWSGKLVKTEKGIRIEFNKATYGDKQ